MKKTFLGVFLMVILVSGLFFVVIAHFGTAQSVESAGAQWMPDSTLVNGLPELGTIGENCQYLIFNLTGNGQWVLIIGQCSMAFLGYYWNGNQWVSNPGLVQGLTAYSNENDPVVGFNITGDNKFDMIVAQGAGSNSEGWTGYAWNGSQWVPNSNIINGLTTNANSGSADNFATLGYNVLSDGKWSLIVDNYGNNGYVGFEWNGTAWTQEPTLVDGLPNAGLPSNGDQFPVPCLVYNFANDNTWNLIVGLASGGGPNGAIQGYQWEGTSWISDPAIVAGITNLQPWVNTPTIAYNFNGNGNWILMVDSTTSNVNQPAYYTGYSWSAGSVPISVSITPVSDSMNVGQSLIFTSMSTGGTWPYKYQWFVNGSAIPGATTTSWIFTPTASGTYYIYLSVTDSTNNTVESGTARIITAYPTQYNVTFSETGLGPDFNGTVVVIDGSSYTANDLPVVFLWSSFSTHTFAFQSPLLVIGNTTEQYDWVSTTTPLTLQPDNSNMNSSTLQSGTFNVTGPVSVIGNYICQQAVSINRVQGYCRGTTFGNSLMVNMTNSPSIGDVLIGIVSTVADTGYPVTSVSITETGVTWNEETGGGSGGTAPGEHGYYMGLWVGKVWGSGANKTITVELSSAADLGATMDVCEYAGVAKLDQSSTKGLQSETTILSTGTLSANQNGELTVGGIADEAYSLSQATNGFTLLDGNYIDNQALAYLEKTNCPIGQENSTITVPGVTEAYGCLATFQPILVESNVTITDQELANGVLSFTASGPSGQIGYVSATVPIGFNSTDITVFNNGQLVQNPVITTDGSDYLISFEIHLSTHNIIIQYGAEASTPTSSPTPIPTASPTQSPSHTSTPTVPELSLLAIMPLLVFFFVAVVYRRYRKNQ